MLHLVKKSSEPPVEQNTGALAYSDESCEAPRGASGEGLAFACLLLVLYSLAMADLLTLALWLGLQMFLMLF